ncbi:MAG TPA: hypothetical protein VH062_21830 [Polyangiaceae bacterium]|jgi:hypothetical protein|nr:hypothetical protein [Polyangiaceae bacterium]
MDGQRQRSGQGRGHRRKPRKDERAVRPEPVMIVARRPDSPLIAKVPARTIAASAVPRAPKVVRESTEPKSTPSAAPEPVRRSARIVQIGGKEADDGERERRKLLSRLMESQGRGAITRAADEFLQHGFELPNEQPVHLQLLEHFDETKARQSVEAMSRLLQTETPIKRPVLDQRLRRLEEHADEDATRELAADLRRALRS